MTRASRGSLPSSPNPGAAVHKCSQCARTFSRPENLKRHRKAHSRVLPHRCQLCPKQFSRSDLLKKHEATHQNGRRSSGAMAIDADQVANQTADQTTDQTTDLWASSQVSASLSPASRINNSSGFDLSVYPNHSQSPHQTVLPDTPQLRQTRQSHDQQQALPIPGPAIEEVISQVPPMSIAAGLPHHASNIPGAHSGNAYHDFSSYMHPWREQQSDGQGDEARNDWFTFDFYQALQETSGQEIDQYADLSDLQVFGLNGFMLHEQTYSQAKPQQRQHEHQLPQSHVERLGTQNPQSQEHELQENTAPVSRAASPPNVPSNEDNWAFAYNPSSATVRQSQPIQIRDDDPLFLNHNPRYDMSAATWDKVRAAVLGEQPGGPDTTAGLILPSLKVANVFIGLFFKHFFPQAPVLHEPTLRIDVLPPPLIAIVVVIGAKYSHLRHTRRFSILLLDRARRSIQTAIENDTRLVRNVHIIYAYALICYTGLWCGNKRAFEIAESLRGTLVTYVRRLPLEEMQNQTAQNASTQHTSATSQNSIETQWQTWATAETQRRLKWFVFTLDSQFPVLLNIRGMLTLAEISDWELPCDDEFWSAPTPRAWKGLLGMAPIPPVPQFTTALLPFLPSLVHGAHSGPSGQSPGPLPMRLNPWSAFLLLATISSQAFELSQEWTLAEAFQRETLQYGGTGGNDNSQAGHGPVSIRFHGLLEQKAKISDSLTLWCSYYGETRIPASASPNAQSRGIFTNSFFQQASSLVYQLTRMLLHVSLTDLQRAMGKEGPRGVQLAKERLRTWLPGQQSDGVTAASSPSLEPRLAVGEAQVLDSAMEAIHTILFISEDVSANAAVPYSLIGLFLAHVLLWAFAFSAPKTLREQLRQRIHQDVPLSTRMTRQLSTALEVALTKEVVDLSSTGSNAIRSPSIDGPQSILKHGAQAMTRLGTWGASLNLALLLHRRVDMEHYIVQLGA